MRRAIPWIFGLLLVLGIGGWTLRAYLHEVAQSGEAAPIGALKSIATAESIFRERPGNGRYGTLAQLRDSKLVDPVLGSGTKQGYIFEAHASTTTP
ncbi:MAG TPA: hypothetical protein VFF73_17910, partial [Planctomycetota bacterium]|nr:hypothetical protein [Planctomycetota bacterium]